MGCPQAGVQTMHGRGRRANQTTLKRTIYGNLGEAPPDLKIAN